MKKSTGFVGQLKRLACAAAGSLLLASAGNVGAHIMGHVYCYDNGATNVIPGVTVIMSCSCGLGPGTELLSTVTDSNGFYSFTVITNSPCAVSVETNTVPPGCDVPICPTFVCDITFGQMDTQIVNFCFGPPPCVACANPALGLGDAAGISIFELGNGNVQINGPAGGIIGNVAIASGGQLQMSGSEYVTGTIELATGATIQNSSQSAPAVVYNVNLSAQISAALSAASADAALPCTQTIPTLDGQTVTTITGGHGMNVICVGNITMNGTQVLLTGPSDAKFIINVTGQFALNGGGAGPHILVDTTAGLLPSDVLFNVIGQGPAVALTGGGGGVNCCAAIVDGTILAPQRQINLSPGLVNGQVISGQNISVVSGSSVQCTPCP
jgi:choice-of-anchor A domain-containing protein